ncbi:family 27 glycoside hydrolase [Trichoderma citrinoviride]|uniref:Alpha-galactosidase n=1 Tax=Trichoderma citrinoviride TaxID=58853 RepID=A0A2T4AZP3_9HYPO|nr:family 27 glycoside hydrolase [Trichoderma citrinoviride]PTB62533.1 family 27 glycoside hydrolase [Trichoderma citrinoviride]
MLTKSALAVAVSAIVVEAIDNGLARTPQMGWNNWNSFGCDVSEHLLLDHAQLINEYGLQDLGYNYVVLDDCWSDGRDSKGKLIADKKKFPRGMAAVADDLHSQGFLFGMYSSAGELTCARYAGSLDHEMDDAQSFADWGVDYLKYDNCYHMGRFGTPLISFERFNKMAEALKATGKNIFYSLCNWGEDYSYSWAASISNSWRVFGDIYDSFARPDDLCSCNDPANPACIAPGTHCSVLAIINRVVPYIDRGLPGGWNDLDMLEVGHGGMTEEEYRAHFTIWAALKAPLLLGTDLRKWSGSDLAIVTNPAVIAINQDPRGRAVQRIRRNFNVPKDEWGVGETHIWSGPLANGDQILVFLNFADEDLDMGATLAEIFLTNGVGGTAPQNKQDWAVHDLWGKTGAAMSNEDAQAVLDADSASERKQKLQKLGWYNSTELSYAEGLKREDPRLFGERVGVIKSGGRFDVRVPRHAGKAFRLRSLSGEKIKQKSHLKKDEL